MRRLLKHTIRLAARSAELGGVLRVLEGMTPGDGVLRVLMYHRVAAPGTEPDLHPGLVSATPASFERQMRFLARRYQVIALREALAALRGGSLPPRAVLLTFDDAYDDFESEAWPILARLGLPATLFVPTAYPDRPECAFWWDRVYAALRGTRRSKLRLQGLELPLADADDRARAFKRLRERIKGLPHEEAMALVEETCSRLGGHGHLHRVLGWEALRRLAAAGLSLAAHSRSHALLDRVPPDRVRAEVRGSLEDLRREIGDAPPVFAYPAGGHDDVAVRILREEGIELAFTTERGLFDLRGDALRARRIPIGSGTSRALLRAQLLPGVSRWRGEPTLARGRAAAA